MAIWEIAVGGGIAALTNWIVSRQTELAAHRLRRRERKEDALSNLAPLVCRLMEFTNACACGRKLAFNVLMTHYNEAEKWRVLHVAHDCGEFQIALAMAPIVAAYEDNVSSSSWVTDVDRAKFAKASAQFKEMLGRISGELGRPASALVPQLIPDPESIPVLDPHA